MNVESVPPRHSRVERYPNYPPVFALLVAGPVLLFWLIIRAVSDWMEKTILAGIFRAVFPWISGCCLVVLVICGTILAWHLYLAWHRVRLHHYERKAMRQQLLIEEKDREAARQRELERVAIERQREADKIELERQRILLEQMKATLEHERMKRMPALLNAGQTAIFPYDDYRLIQGQPALPPAAGRQPKEQIGQHSVTGLPDLPLRERVEVTEEREIRVPVAPAFWDIAYLITEESMPLCFVVDEDPESPYYGETVPQFGTIDDLLSLAVIGKPGRGKTVLLMYYAAILLARGAEVHIFDPHGVMGELALLHGRELPGMPPTARVYYYDRKKTMLDAVPKLMREMDDRDQLCRLHLEGGKLVSRKVKHPLLILADELPILADFDEQIRAEYKEKNRNLEPGEPKLEVPSLLYLIRRTVLEARKWRMFFCGSSQSIDATILPTKVTDALNSRIVFFNSDRKARMVGLEADVIKKMLPLLRRAGPGVTIYDCARWDAPKIGAIPNITAEDLLEFLGVDMDALEERWIVEAQASESQLGAKGHGLRIVLNEYRTDANVPTERLDTGSQYELSDTENEAFIAFQEGRSEAAGRVQNVQESGQNELVEPSERVLNAFVPHPGEKMLDDVQKHLLVTYYEDCHDVKVALRRIKNEKTGEGLGVGTYYRHACVVLDSLGLRKKRA